MTIDTILFVNGVNTNFGGAGKQSFDYWIRRLEEKRNIKCLHSNPMVFKTSIFFSYLLFFLYHLPGSIFRIFNLTIFEYIFKISFIFPIVFLYQVYKVKPKEIILSHHSVFYLILFKFFFKKIKFVLLVHDIVYLRHKTFSNSKILNKLIKIIEFNFFKYADLILIQSLYETKIVKRFHHNTYAISPLDPKFISKSNPNLRCYFFADWRRFENADSLLDLYNKFTFLKKIKFTIYGFSYENISNQIYKKYGITFKKGNFSDYKSVDEYNLFVIINKGSGIKLKIIEAILNGKRVVSTREGLMGYYGIKSKLLINIENKQLQDYLRYSPTYKDYLNFITQYKLLFNQIEFFF